MFVQWHPWWNLWKLVKSKPTSFKIFSRTPCPRGNAEGSCLLQLPMLLLLPPYWIKSESRPPRVWAKQEPRGRVCSPSPTVSLVSPHPHGASWPVRRVLTCSLRASATISPKCTRCRPGTSPWHPTENAGGATGLSLDYNVNFSKIQIDVKTIYNLAFIV